MGDAKESHIAAMRLTVNLTTITQQKQFQL